MKSFVAYSSDSDFPLENIPFGVFSTKESSTPRVCSRIGDYVIDLVKLSPLFEGPHLKEHAKSVFAQVCVYYLLQRDEQLYIRTLLTSLCPWEIQAGRRLD